MIIVVASVLKKKKLNIMHKFLYINMLVHKFVYINMLVHKFLYMNMRISYKNAAIQKN